MSQLPSRPGQNGVDGYTNGYYNDQGSNHNDHDYRNGGPVGGGDLGAVSREHRAGGYGGFQNGTPPTDSDTHRSRTLPRSRGQPQDSVNGRSETENGEWSERSRSRGDRTGRVGGGQGSRQIEG